MDFTRSGWRQFMRLNRSQGARFLRGFVLRYELAAYLTAHEAASVELDEGCQEVCYENGVYLLLRKMQGVWYITDVFAAEETVAYGPVFFWQKIRRGADFILAHVLSSWRQLTERMVLSISLGISSLWMKKGRWTTNGFWRSCTSWNRYNEAKKTR